MQEKEFQAHVHAAMSTLDAVVAKGEDFAPMIAVIRGGRMVAQIIPGDGDGGTIAKTARVAAAAFGADELVLISDSFMASGQSMVNPVTGKEWQHGDMEDLVTNHHGLERGFVVEAITVFHTGYDVAARLVSLPYRRLGQGRVEWLSPTDLQDGRDAQVLRLGRFAEVFDGLNKEMQVPDPIAVLLLGRMDADVGLAFFEDETDPMMLALKSDLDSGKLRTR